MSQTPCPNCGGYKINPTTNYVRKVPGTKVQKIALVIEIQIVLILVFLFWKSRLNVDPVNLLISFIMLDIIISLLAVNLVRWNKSVGHRYSCQLCGYQWDWYIGDPWPKVTVQPDLIVKGALNLQQQQSEEARKREQDLEALHYLTHQKK